MLLGVILALGSAWWTVYAGETAYSDEALAGEPLSGVSYIERIWDGTKVVYSCICDAELEKQATEEFMRFVLSFTPDISFIQRREQLAYDKWVQAMQFANQLSAQAQQAQIQAQQRAIEASRVIARNSAEMSAGIMDSWNRKMASDSRISQSRSEAIRGVNTYQTTYGRN